MAVAPVQGLRPDFTPLYFCRRGYAGNLIWLVSEASVQREIVFLFSETAKIVFLISKRRAFGVEC